jgi:hypothetical protein
MTTESKSIQCSGPEMADTIAEHEAAGWRTVAVVCFGASDYRVEFIRPANEQGDEG